MTDCDFVMRPAGVTFNVWHCRLEKDHRGQHEPRESLREISLAYFTKGKDTNPTPTTQIIEPGHEVPLGDVVKVNADGKINRQSTLGKLAASLIESDQGWVTKAGVSRYQTVRAAAPSSWQWIEARNPHHHLVANSDNILYDGREVTVKEAVDLIHGVAADDVAREGE